MPDDKPITELPIPGPGRTRGTYALADSNVTATLDTTDPKPGYKTTEFWLKLTALVLTALYASGVIPTSGSAATVAAIAATMLGALGYTVARSWVKAS
jgi:hypothetical protein